MPTPARRRPHRALAGGLGAMAVALVLLGCAPVQPTLAPSTTVGASPTTAPASAGRLDPAAVSGHLAYSAPTGAGSEDVFLWGGPSSAEAPRRLTGGDARAFDPDLSPDGTLVVYRVNPDPQRDDADLWLLPAGSGANAPRAAVRLTHDPSENNWSPAWSPDATRIAFASTREARTPRLWTMAADGSDRRLVTTGHGEYPDWSPDGARLVYAAPVGSGSYELWVTAAEGNVAPTRITTTPTTEFAPAWSPDARWIAFQFDTGSGWEIWLVRPDGADRRRASLPGEEGAWPTWTPSGLLVWNGSQGLTFLDVATGARASVPAPPGGADFLSWSR